MLWSNDAEVVGGACSYVRVRNRPGLESQRCTAVHCKHAHKKQQSAVFGPLSRFCAAYYVKVQNSGIWINDVKYNRAPKRSQKPDIFIVLVGNFIQILEKSGQNPSTNCRLCMFRRRQYPINITYVMDLKAD